MHDPFTIPNDLSDFSGKILSPTSLLYAAALQIDNGRIQSRPRYVLQPSNNKDIQRAIDFCRTAGLQMTIKGGGHGAAGYCLNEGGVVLDLSQMNHVDIDAENRVAKVQAGATWRDVYAAILASGENLVPVGGGCADVGVAGFLLGGGYSFLSRSYGLGCDNILDITVITANGEAITAGTTSTEKDAVDLFWACRGGGGGNFGVAAEFSIQLHRPPTDRMLMAEFRFPASDAIAIMEFYNTWIEDLPDEMAIYGIWRASETIPEVSNKTQTIGFTAIYNGNMPDGLKILAPLLNMSPIYTRFVSTSLPQFELQNGRNTVVKGSSAYMRSGTMDAKRWGSDCTKICLEFMERAPSPECFLVWTHAGGSVRKFPSGQTAFAHRNALLVPQVKGIWNEESLASETVRWTHNFFERLSPYFSGSYVNYIDPLLPNWQTAYYGQNYQRLVDVKERWDPDRFFEFPRAIGSNALPSNTLDNIPF